MRREIVALLIQEGSRFFSQYLKMRSFSKTTATSLEITPPTIEAGEAIIDAIPYDESIPLVPHDEKDPSSIAVGCVPCAMGHYGACSGELNEAMRFARSDGLGSNEVIDRIGQCLDELNVMEREDLRPQMIVGLKSWEKELANEALSRSREIRHQLENISSVDDLEAAAAITQEMRMRLGRGWWKERLDSVTPEEEQRYAHQAIQKLKDQLSAVESEEEEDD